MPLIAKIEELAEAMDRFVSGRTSARLFSFASARGYHYEVVGVVLEEQKGGVPTGQLAVRVKGEWA